MGGPAGPTKGGDRMIRRTDSPKSCGTSQSSCATGSSATPDWPPPSGMAIVRPERRRWRRL